jgi:hypothetical protein
MIFEKIEDEDFLPFTKLTLPTAFNLRVYIPRQYDQWIFSMALTQIAFAVMSFLLVAAFVIMVGFSIALSAYVLLEIYKEPTLGVWSYILFAYSAIVLAGSILWFVRFNFPLPYRDKSSLKR